MSARRGPPATDKSPVIERVAGAQDLLAVHAAWPERYPALLESAASGTPQGRFDILFATTGERLVLAPHGRLGGPAAKEGETDFLAALDRWHLETGPAPGAPGLPFSGGWFLFLGYELAAQVEPTLQLRTRPGFPVAFALRCPAAAMVDRETGYCHLVAEAGAAEVWLPRLRADLAAAPALPEAPSPLIRDLRDLREDDPGEYLAAVTRARHYIFEGDVFQANLARRWRGRLPEACAPASVYARLRHANPGPFAGIVQWAPGQAIVSSSPERLLILTPGKAETRPIAGTRPRGLGAAADKALSRELLRHPKERAEHLMLIDLARNDLGRFCQPGTVDVNEMMVLESYAHVHHIVSNVRGVPQEGVTPGAAIRAVFPGGTITGCPKVRCMEIIAELEQGPRGPYTGSMGYLARDGQSDLNILIRTLVQNGADIDFHAGAGIVADSRPDRELEETRAKARGMVLALEGGAHA